MHQTLHVQLVAARAEASAAQALSRTAFAKLAGQLPPSRGAGSPPAMLADAASIDCARARRPASTIRRHLSRRHSRKPF